MILSILIPTYNRGNHALKRAEEILPFLSDSVDLYISDNASEKYLSEYKELKSIKNPYFHYSRNNENLFFIGNIIKLIMEADGDFCLITSDEDSVIGENIIYYLNFLSMDSNIAFVKARTIENYHIEQNNIAQPGMDAIKLVYQTNNYISGTIYNTKILKQKLLELNQSFNMLNNERNEAYYYYPHLFYDAFLATKGECIFCKIPLISENKPNKKEEELRKNKKQKYICISGLEYTSYESRIKQFEGFLPEIKFLDITYAEQLEMVKILILKYIMLISNLKFVYKASEFNKIKIKMCKQMKYILDSSKIIAQNEHLQLFNQLIEECCSNI